MYLNVLTYQISFSSVFIQLTIDRLGYETFQFYFTISQVSWLWHEFYESLTGQNSHFSCKSLEIKYLIRAPDCNLHSPNAETYQNLFKSINLEWSKLHDK